MTNPAKLRTTLCASTAIAGALLFLAAPAAAQTLPDTGNVTTVTTGLGGAVPGSTKPTFSTNGAPGAETLRVDLRDNRTIINWGGTGFNIAAGNTVDFKDARATSGVTGRTDNVAVLNRVFTGAFSRSNIGGSIRSDPNVAVYLINTNGIVMSGTSTVDVGSFLAGTLDATDADFFDGNDSMHFTGTSAETLNVQPGATINTSATVSSSGGRLGDLVLVSPYLGVGGTLTAAGGDVGLVMAQDVTVQNAPGSPLSFTIGAITRDDRATLSIGGNVSGKNVIAVLGRTDVNGLRDFEGLGTITATGAEATDRGIVLTLNKNAPGVAFGPGVAPSTGTMAFAGTLVSAKDIWINAPAEQVNAISGSMTAAGLIDITGGFSLGVIRAGSIAIHGGASFENRVTTTVGNLSYDGPRGINILGVTTIAGDLIGDESAFLSHSTLTVGGNISITTPGAVNFWGTTHAMGSITVTGARAIGTSNGELVAANGDITLRGTGQITLFGNVFAGGKVDAEAGNDMQVGSITGTHGIRLVANGNGSHFDSGRLLFGWAGASAYTLSAPASDADLILKAVRIRKYSDLQFGTETPFDYQAGRDVILTQTDPSQTLRLGTVTAGRNVEITSGNTLGATTIRGQSGSVTAKALNGGSLTVGTIFAGNDATVSGSLTLVDTLTTTLGNVLVTSTGTTVLGGATGTGMVSVGGDITVNATGTAQLRGTVTAGGDIEVTGSSIFLGTPPGPSFIKAKGAIALTATTGSVSGSGEMTLQSNSDGVGNEDLTLSAVTTVSFTGDAWVLGGTERQSDVRVRSGANNYVYFNAVSARSLLGATGNDPFTNGITRNAQVILTQVSLTNSFYASGTSVTTNNVTVSNGNIDVRSGIGLTLSGALNAAGDVNLQTSSGNLTIAASGSVSGRNVVLSTPAVFINNAGASALTAADRWTVYSANPSDNSFGGLNSNTQAFWGSTIATRAPSTFSGNRYVFAIRPTLTINPLNFTKTYGDDLSLPINQTSLYTVTGFHPGMVGAFLGDTASSSLLGAPSISSGGLAMRASVAGGPYPIDIALGTLTSPSGYALALGGDSGAITVTPKALAITYIANDKFYDGTTAGTGTVRIDGIVAGDTVTAGGTTWTFDGKNAASGRVVTVAGTTITGADLANYSFTLPAGAVTADILKARLNINISANDKTYDGTVAATGTASLIGVIDGENVTLTGGTLQFASKDAGAGVAVFLQGALGLSGADSGNYELGNTSAAQATIFRKALTGTVTATSKTYDGTTVGSGTIVLNGVIQGDAVGTEGTVWTFADKNADTGKTVAVSGTLLNGGDAGNYTLTVPVTTTADILRKALTGTLTANSKTYDGTTAGSGSVALNGVVQGDAVGTSSSVWNFSDKNAGTGKTVTLSGTTLTGGDAANYSLSLPATTTADILRKALTGTVAANGKTYDGTTLATGAVALNGVVQGDSVGTTGSVWTFSDKNAGTGKTVTISGTSLSGADAGNYTLSLPSTAMADILRKALTGTISVDGKTYDGTTSATGTVTLNGVVEGDQVGTSGTVLAFADKDAGTGKTVTVSGTTLIGGDAANYTLTLPATAAADILKRGITGTIAADGKTYDGTTSGTGTVTLTGVLQGDTVGTTGSVWTFADKNAGTGKTVTLTGTMLTGADGGNYTLTLPATALADIMRKALTGTISANAKTYDGTTTASGSIALNGVVQGNAVGTSGSVWTFSDKNAGTGRTVTLTGTILSGGDAGNYTLTLPSTTLADILRRALIVTPTADSKTYDGTISATGSVSLGNVVQGDQVGTTGTVFAFVDKNASTGKTVNVTGTTLTGADAGNYTLSIPATVLGDILKRAITGTVTADNKTYDGTTTGSGTVLIGGVLQGDQVGTTGTTWTFSGKDAGTGKVVTISGTTLNGADGGNYTLTLPASALADILKKAVTGTVTIIGRQYDGTTAASGTVTLNGIVQGDQLGTTGTVLTYADRNAGTGKAVSVSGTTLNGADAGNYTLTMPASATGDILKRIVGVGADDQSKTRDDEDPLLTFTISSGSLVTGDTFSGGLVRASGETPGPYAITIGTLTLGNNYQISFTPGVFTIELNPASDGLPPAFKALFLPSQLSAQPQSGTSVTIDKDDLCGEDAGCVVQ